MTVPVVFGPGFYEEEDSFGHPHRWAATRASLTLALGARDRRRTELQADVSTLSLRRTVRVYLARRYVARFAVTPNRSTRIDVTVPPMNDSSTLTFVASPPARADAGGRLVALSFANVSAEPVLTTPNLVENGSFEVNAAPWSARAPNTFVRSTRLAKAGRASGLATRDIRTDDTDVANFPLVLTAGKTYTFACWLYIPSSYSGGEVVLNPEWVSPVSGTAAIGDTTIRNQWQRASGVFTIGSTTAGYVVLRMLGAKTGDFVYIDDVTVQATS